MDGFNANRSHTQAQHSNSILAYWCQREQSDDLEIPALNEVDDLDTIRGIVGIASAVLIALTLIPLP